MPTQYARLGDDVVIAVAHPDQKRWWRNFSHERPGEFWKDGGWHPVRLRVLGDPDETRRARKAYSARFTSTAQRLDSAVLIASRAL